MTLCAIVLQEQSDLARVRVVYSTKWSYCHTLKERPRCNDHWQVWRVAFIYSTAVITWAQCHYWNIGTGRVSPLCERAYRMRGVVHFGLAGVM
jgi:hypothetical protein